MQLKMPSELSKTWCRMCVSFLAFSWVFGLSSGMYLAHIMQEHIFLLMRMVPSSPVSIVGLLIVLLFPLLLSAFAVYLSTPAVLLPIVFFVGFTFGFCSIGVLDAFGSAGWLVRLLLMFSVSLMCVPLFWFWIRHVSGNRCALGKDLALCTGFAAIICIFDYILVSPFLMMLMNN